MRRHQLSSVVGGENMAEVRWFKTMKEYSDYVKAAGKGRVGEEYIPKELEEEKKVEKKPRTAKTEKKGKEDE